MGWIETIAEVPALASFDARDLLRLGVVTSWPAGEVVWDPGEESLGLCFLLQGAVKFVVPTGRRGETILGVARAGRLLCGSVPCMGIPYCCRAIAVDEVAMLSLPVEVVLGKVDTPTRGLACELAVRNHGSCQRLRIALKHDARERLKATLAGLSEGLNASTRDDGRVQFPRMPRATVAGLSGMTVETVVRILGEFRELGIVEEDSKTMIVDVARIGGLGDPP